MDSHSIESEYVNVPWTIIRSLLTREQEDAYSIAALQNRVMCLENSLHATGWRAQQEQVNSNALSAHYDQLHRDYLRLFEAYEHLEKRINHTAHPNGLGFTLGSKERLTSEDIQRQAGDVARKDGS
ncbi:hypothetical protein N7540_005583 [Penicillium herquei]|nr:hypothetical protein N7540_005583 [Penicillium herquei]